MCIRASFTGNDLAIRDVRGETKKGVDMKEAYRRARAEI
jgi:hypothetical protein